MDHSWRHQPPVPTPSRILGNLCPVCSISHFPFCPTSHTIPFHQNLPGFQYNSHSFRRSFPDPFLDHPGPSRAFAGHPGDRLGDPVPWQRNPSLDYGDGFDPRYDQGSGGPGFKRMRVEENWDNSSRILMDDERRLKLIRDHGGLESVRSDEFSGSREDMALKRSANYEMEGYGDRSFGDFDKTGTFFDTQPHFNPPHYGEEKSFGQRNLHGNGQLEQHQYGQVKNSMPPSFQTNGYSGLSTRYSTNVEQSRQGLDVATLHHKGGVWRNPNLEVIHPTANLPGESYHHNGFQQNRPSDALSTKESHYSHAPGWNETSTSSALHNEQTLENPNAKSCPPHPYAKQNHVLLDRDFNSHGQINDRGPSYDDRVASSDGNQDAVAHQNMLIARKIDPLHSRNQVSQPPIPARDKFIAENSTPMHPSRLPSVQPPLPASPPPPLPMDLPQHPLYEPHSLSSPAKTTPPLFPIPVSSAASTRSPYAAIPEADSMARPYFPDKSHFHVSIGISPEEFQALNQTSSTKFLGKGQRTNKPKVVDALHIFKQPHRATRPDHIVIILRGLPGSGKSYLAKMLRDLEVENGGDAPRIHSMDDYFMTEVEKVEETDVSKPPGSVRGKKPVLKKVMEYCYEPEMEEVYRTSMLKAFKKTLDDGAFSFVIVDDRNLRVADFAQFWATAKRSGYEVYLLEATYKDPAGCAARNVHGFTHDDIEKMSRQWEEAPSLYLKLDIKSLLHADDLKGSGIQEVDMDTDDGDAARSLNGSGERNLDTQPTLQECSPDDEKWNAGEDHPREEVKELGRSKWSDDLDDDNAKKTEATKGNRNALSGLIKAYAKGGKSVHWGDKDGNTGFSIGVARKVNSSLVIGPGAGYNLKSNPLPEEHVPTPTSSSGGSKKKSAFQERIREERASFRAVFDKRRQRIGRLDLEDE
ncbi:uncharacterized protein LOC127789667 [Diospyros lotus]|uniref:uncharacterized protein LOC127789667 n=1 Tax=Diospyros lotus TaxID=55363 RepID=UPI002259E747|nr:uncharacterized protein LOC127789667 [Diospyros lotus]